MIIGIDPLVDFAAKRVLGSPEHEPITLHFLNSMLRLPMPIVEVTITNPINLKKFDADKLSVLDVKAVDSIGRRYNIEVQTTRPLGLTQRLLYYAAKQYVDQMLEGDQYAKLNPSIGICLLDSVLFHEHSELQHAFAMRTEGGALLTDRLQVHVFELPKYAAPSDNEPIADPASQWLHFFQRAAESTAEELARRLPDPVFAEAIRVLQMISKTPEERQIYEDRLKAERDQWAVIAQAELDGREKGLQEGRSEGRREGELIGQAKLVAALQNLVGDPVGSLEALTSLGPEELVAKEVELQRRLRERS